MEKFSPEQLKKIDLAREISSLMSLGLSPSTPLEVRRRLNTLGRQALDALYRGDEKELKDKLDRLRSIHGEFSESKH